MRHVECGVMCYFGITPLALGLSNSNSHFVQDSQMYAEDIQPRAHVFPNMYTECAKEEQDPGHWPYPLQLCTPAMQRETRCVGYWI